MKNLTKKEKVELSWNFLYEITETVMNKFSKEDKEAVLQLGKMLHSNGMSYEHVVELAVTSKKVKSQQAVELDQQKEETSQRSI